MPGVGGRPGIPGFRGEFGPPGRPGLQGQEGGFRLVPVLQGIPGLGELGPD